MSLLEIVKKVATIEMLDENQSPYTFKILPGISKKEIETLEKRLPCPIPDDVKELLVYSSGFENCILQSLDFTGSLSFEISDISPHTLPIAHDGMGNFWFIDLTSQSKTWGPVFFACHNPAVIIYQSDTLEQFIEDFTILSQQPLKSEINNVYQKYSIDMWKNNPNVLTY